MYWFQAASARMNNLGDSVDEFIGDVADVASKVTVSEKAPLTTYFAGAALGGVVGHTLSQPDSVAPTAIGAAVGAFWAYQSAKPQLSIRLGEGSELVIPPLPPIATHIPRGGGIADVYFAAQAARIVAANHGRFGLGPYQARPWTVPGLHTWEMPSRPWSNTGIERFGLDTGEQMWCYLSDTLCTPSAFPSLRSQVQGIANFGRWEGNDWFDWWNGMHNAFIAAYTPDVMKDRNSFQFWVHDRSAPVTCLRLAIYRANKQLHDATSRSLGLAIPDTEADLVGESRNDAIIVHDQLYNNSMDAVHEAMARDPLLTVDKYRELVVDANKRFVDDAQDFLSGLNISTYLKWGVVGIGAILAIKLVGFLK